MTAVMNAQNKKQKQKIYLNEKRKTNIITSVMMSEIFE